MLTCCAMDLVHSDQPSTEGVRGHVTSGCPGRKLIPNSRTLCFAGEHGQVMTFSYQPNVVGLPDLARGLPNAVEHTFEFNRLPLLRCVIYQDAQNLSAHHPANLSTRHPRTGAHQCPSHFTRSAIRLRRSCSQPIFDYKVWHLLNVQFCHHVAGFRAPYFKRDYAATS